MQQTMVLGILVFDRVKEAGMTQRVLTRYADLIRTRLGFHELSDSVCSRVGTILLVLQGDTERWKALEDELTAIGGVEVKRIKFDHIFKQ